MNKKHLLLLSTILLALPLVFATMTGSETMTRTVSSTTISPGQTFTLTYTAQGTSGTWGASIVDAVSGGCSFPAGTTYSSVMLSADGQTKTVTITAPQSGTCTFTGDYKYGEFITKPFSSLTVTISSTPIVCTSGATQNCIASNTCSGTQTCSNNAWGTCATTLQKCSDGTCKSTCPTPCVIATTCTSLGKTCGEATDNCGNPLSCGVCQSGYTCTNGACVSSGCVGSCSGKTCGDNGCGGSCGVCTTGQTCTNYQCTISGATTCTKTKGQLLCGECYTSSVFGLDQASGCKDIVGLIIIVIGVFVVILIK